MIRRSGWVVALAAVLLALVPAARAEAPPTGLELRSATQLTPRLTELRLSSPALGRETGVRVLTPDGFDPATDHLPVLWLLHGGFGSERDWTEVGNAEALTAGLPMLVVMPAAGIGGWYSDWQQTTLEGPQRWETYHLSELRPFIEARYGTRTDRDGRAIVGLSMGGFGAMHDAARHPDLFGFAASFSGAVDILHPGVSAIVSASPLAHQGLPPQLFGDRILDETRWRANNPVDLAANLRSVELQIRTGNGFPGGVHGGGPDPQEFGVQGASTSLHHQLDDLGIPHLFDDYGPGAHQWPYWQDDLAATLPAVVAHFARPPAPVPSGVTHVAFEPSYSVWGHDVALTRPGLERSSLTVGDDGFTLRGSGRGTVTTPARYAPGQVLQVASTSSDPRIGDRTTTVVADATGRATVRVDLGTGLPTDEYPLGRLAGRPQWTVAVTLTPI